MLKQQATIFRRIAIALDIVTIATAFMLAYYQRRLSGSVTELNDYVWLLFFAIPAWLVLLNHFKIYESLRVRTNLSIIWALFKVHAVGAIMLSSVIYLLDPHGYSRLLFTEFILIGFLLTCTIKILAKQILGNLRRKGYNYKNILIIGTGQSALKVSEIINAHQAWGLNVAGFLSARDDELKIDDTIQHPPILGTINSVIEVCKNTTIDEVVIALNKDDDVDVECLVREIQNLGLVVRVVVDFLALSGSNTEVSLLNNEVPLLTYCSFALNSNQLLTKRCLDIVGSLVGLTLTALLFPFIALAIKLDSPGSLFFGQPRVRENGRRFICWKFRTMNADAESQKHTLAAHNEMKGPMFKVSNDPRITKVGRFLRKSSLDELPQFWNVLRGDMSLVGTRPPTPDEVEKYQNWHRKRISIKPGITGLWQVSGRSQIENFDDVVRLDIRYIEEWSFWLDIKLLLKTLSVVVTGRGAS